MFLLHACFCIAVIYGVTNLYGYYNKKEIEMLRLSNLAGWDHLYKYRAQKNCGHSASAAKMRRRIGWAKKENIWLD